MRKPDPEYDSAPLPFSGRITEHRRLALEHGEELAGWLIDLRLAMIDYAAGHSLAELLTFVLDETGALVASPLGFYHFIEADQRTISLQQWSTSTVAMFCRAEGKGFHYDLQQAGVWADCVREKRVVVHNDYPSLPHRRGLPAGHAEVTRELVVPVIREGRIMAILGVGNKASDYSRKDIDIVSYLADVSWEIARRKQAEDLLNQQRDIESACAGLSARLLTSTYLAETSLTVLATARGLTRSRTGFIGSIEPGSGRLVVHGLGEGGQEGAVEPLDSAGFAGLWGLVLRERRPLMANHAASDSRSAPLPGSPARIEAFLGVPVLTGGEVVGIIALANPESSYLEGDLILAQRLADLYALALQRHRLEAAMIEAEARRTLELEHLVAAMLHNTPLAMVFFVVEDDRIRILDWNQSAEKIFGWSRAEVLGRNFLEFLPYGEDMPQVADICRNLKEHPGAHNLVNRCNSKSGALRMVHWFNHSFTEAGTGRLYAVSLGHDITAQHAYEERLRRSEEHLRTIADFTFDWEEWRAPDGSYLYVSPSCERVTGYTREEFLKNSALTLDIIHPDDRYLLAGHLHNLAERDPCLMDYRIVTRDGKIRWISHSCQPVYGEAGEWLGRRGSNRDITDRKDAEQRLLESRNMLQLVFDGIRDPLLLMEANGTILIMNSAACAYFRVVPGDACGRKCRDLACSGPPCRDCRIIDSVEQGESTVYERRGLFDPDRVERVYLERLRPTGAHPAMAIVRIRDITREKQIEKDLLQAEKMIALGTLVSGVAHEINNPNNFISLNINLLREVWASLNPVLEKYHREHGDFLAGGLPYSEMKTEIPNLLGGIEAGARRIQKIVHQLREYSLPGRGLLDENLHLNEIVRQALSLIDKEVSRATANFSVSYGSELPPLSGSGQKLEQVVINLVLNACQSLPDREKAVRVSTTCNRDDDTVSLIVEDEGCGIAESTLPQIMNPFFTTKRDIGGTGLGLSVSSRIVAEHHGRMDVKSEPGAGSTFTVTLPTSAALAGRDNL